MADKIPPFAATDLPPDDPTHAASTQTPDLHALAARLQALEDTEAIKQLKYRYWRALDMKDWDGLGTCFTESASVRYGDGKFTFEGRKAIVDFYYNTLRRENGVTTIHHGHHPEITLNDTTRATGHWSLYHYMFNAAYQRGVRIGAYYKDKYIKTGNVWKIEATDYTPLLHEEWNRRDTPSLQVIYPVGGTVLAPKPPLR